MASTTILNGQFAMFEFIKHKIPSDTIFNASTSRLDSTSSKSRGWYRRCIDNPDDDIDGTLSTISDLSAQVFGRVPRAKRNDAFRVEEATPRRRRDAILHVLRCSCRSRGRYKCFRCGKGRSAVFKYGEDVECVLVAFRRLSVAQDC